MLHDVVDVEVEFATKGIDDVSQCSILLFFFISNQIRRPECISVSIYYVNFDNIWILLLIKVWHLSILSCLSCPYSRPAFNSQSPDSVGCMQGSARNDDL